MFLEDCKVLENQKVGEDYYLMKIESKKASQHSKAGQFFMLKLKNEIRILRRPISLHYADKERNILEFYYEVKGGGTKEFAQLESGDILNIQGPLGTGFTTQLKDKKCVVVGGGMGIAPTKLLIDELKKNNEVIFIAGGRGKEALNILSNLNLEGVKTYITTDDGSLGEKGNVISVLSKVLAEEKIDIVQTCGPHKMMEAVAETAGKAHVFCEVSLEERMACGVKACVGCSIKTLDGMKKVCHDGPVFDSKIIVDVNPKENTGCNCGN
ncbi:dihydroorotate dehydrogenase electron transfer subunit [Candidatus Cetobacterium colombiensis]|jgi:dihydroorotate dehydrogenase electron transfer subunit|uniref:Dihydroorotate dehydrogenase electron transfer subunit n=1 Tax=Candidatus Cetobacterium colombiensis TaxID=3073100 RepID=A0ABU4W8F9_9FUSO|nr:dihydroorotate dehydrogenase electron transfer subunit [Candidatus Cetobacterium colombiensis]MDX8335805.1 dihydroorotate dehydrogenase electron transfer subunit [Candidatus Cetobacterium colombiensis]